ncbi:hypothetical protein SAMN05216337_1017146 [Bradyrhizobium brasilense]|uniref:Uncharacterized protein n=1 Tax=Bradyrhizobium brasilense TaxID=1419277 RepID=A0A1G6YYJ5_9BRAD|nr:hypothetical protein SAMN05216337_1017146 [Bradyrhizobium brasilense]
MVRDLSVCAICALLIVSLLMIGSYVLDQAAEIIPRPCGWSACHLD